MERSSTPGSARLRAFPGRFLIRLARAGWVLTIVGIFACLAAAWVAGWRLENVQSASMTPLIPKGSLAVVAPVSPRRIEAGDVISFFDPAHRQARILHRVESVVDRGAEGRFFRTQGDANATPDALLVPSALVEGGLRWHVPRLGNVAWLLRPPAGLALLVGLSAVVMLVGGDARARRDDRQEAPDPQSNETRPVQPERKLTSEELRQACAASWRTYFVHDIRLDVAAGAKANLAASWRDYYVSAVRSDRTIDIRDRAIELDRVEDSSAQVMHTQRGSEARHLTRGKGK